MTQRSTAPPRMRGWGQASNETGDYSYLATTTYTDTTHVTVYRNGQIIWGIEP